MTDELIGKQINGYEMLSLIGLGGMARVYLARQHSMNRQVALKVLPKQFINDDTYLGRFEREVQIVSQLEHRNIIPVYDYGEFEGQPYIVMRYMPSGSVDDLLSRGALPFAKIVNILAQIAPALDYAHTKGVLHRDLKPSNILLDEADGAYLTDFGIARLAHQKGTTITTQGVVGTPSYMSPEQAQGKTLDGRSDVYSLGVMLFELATGRRPFESDTPYSIAVMQVTTSPPSPRSYNALLSASMEAVILKSLQKDPAQRYQTAQALYDAFKQAVEQPNAPITPATPARPVQSVQSSASYTPAPALPVAPAPFVTRYPTPQNVSYVNGKPRKRPLSAWWGLALGGLFGCGALAVLVVVAMLLANQVLPVPPTQSLSPSPSVLASESPTGAPSGEASNMFATNTAGAPTTPAPTLDATSESARATLLARQTAFAPTPSP